MILSNDDLQYINAYAKEALVEKMPFLTTWLIDSIAGGITNEVSLERENLNSSDEVVNCVNANLAEVYALISTSESASVWDSDEQFAKLAHFITNTVEWGTMAIEVKGGKPVMIRDYRKDIKL